MLFQNLLKSFRGFGDNVFVDSYWSGTSVRDPGEGGELHLMKLKMVIFNHQREDTSFSEQQIILMEVCTHHPLLEDSFPK